MFRNQGSLWLSYESIRDQIKKEYPDFSYEFIFTDDGSDDNSLSELLEIRSADPQNVTVIRFSRNFGQFAAISAGLQRAKGDMVVSISADCQDPPELIPKMIAGILDGYDIVLGTRESRNDSVIKNLTAAIHFKLMRIENPTYPKGGFDFWMLSRKALQSQLQFTDHIRSMQVDILSLGYKVLQIPYERRRRTIGKSQYNFSKRLKVSLNQILSTSYWPLRLASSIGLVTTLFGFLFAMKIVYNYFFTTTPFDGWAPIMVVQLVLGGMTIFMLGISGEYLWRIYHETKARPMYLINEILSPEQPKVGLEIQSNDELGHGEA